MAKHKFQVAEDSLKKERTYQAYFLRSSLGLPEPHETIKILNNLTDVEQKITLWSQAWEQTQRSAQNGTG